MYSLNTLIMAGLFKNIWTGKSRTKTSLMNLQHLLVDLSTFSVSLIKFIVFVSDRLKSTHGKSKHFITPRSPLKITENVFLIISASKMAV